MVKVVKKYGVELVKESSKKYELDGLTIRSPKDGAKVVLEVFNLQTSTQEKFVMLALNAKNQVIGAFEIFTGTISESLVSPRDIFQRLLLVNAKSYIVAHNHPSGNCEPSREDIQVTQRLVEAGKLMSIELLDHVIVGEDNVYVSLAQKGYIS